MRTVSGIIEAEGYKRDLLQKLQWLMFGKVELLNDNQVFFYMLIGSVTVFSKHLV